MRTRALLTAVAGTLVLGLAGCASAPSPAAAPSPQLAAPGGTADGVQLPVPDAPLTPGARYRFDQVVIGRVALELTAPDPAAVNYSVPTTTVLTTSVAFETDILWFVDADEIRVATDPWFSPEDIASQEDLERVSQAAPEDLLGFFAAQTYLTVTAPARPITIAGQQATAIDVLVKDLPADAERCAYGTIQRCAELLVGPGIGQAVQAGQRYRIATLTVQDERILVTQNLDVPSAQTVLDQATFLPQT